MTKLSRAKIAAYFAGELMAGKRDAPKRLAALLLATQRTGELELIVANIERNLSEHGIILADVTTAHPLDKGFERTVRQLLAVGKTDTVILREHIDPDLIGGVKIRAGGRELDTTVRHKLNQLKATSAA